MRGKHIDLFLVEGKPGGITTAEIVGWAGHVLTGPRASLSDILARDTMNRSGAYLLLRTNDLPVEGAECYIGRSENLRARLRNHDANTGFWDRVVLITTKDDSFNEGHWGYLEARLVELFQAAERSSMPNVQTPRHRKLSEAQISDMEAFLDEIQVILPVLGINVLRSRKKVERLRKKVEELQSASHAKSPIFHLDYPARGIAATAQVINGEFYLLQGSTVIPRWQGVGKAETTKRSYAALKADHDKLVADGSIEVRGRVGVVTRDIVFASPSRAGTLVLGRACNGRLEWRWKGGTYADWENRGLDA